MSAISEKKKILVASILQFLQHEVNESSLCEEKKESLEVAIQCLETAYDSVSQDQKGAVDLLQFISVASAKVDITDTAKAKAEDFKNEGNAAMKNNQYVEALAAYTRAIELNPTNAVYFCNRAAANSRLEKHYEALADCTEAIKLDPTYGKAYGRLGIAYSNLNMFEEAKNAYAMALKYDPNNSMYEANLQAAEQQLAANAQGQSQARLPFDFAQCFNNPAIMNTLTQMLGDQNFRNVMSGFMNSAQSENANFAGLFQAAQAIAARLEDADPNFAETFRRSLNPENQNPSNPSNGSNDDRTDS